MALDFGNVRKAEDTIERMVLSTMIPRHREAYAFSCYGRVCHTIRTDENLQPNDEVVLLGMEADGGVIHSVLVRGDIFLTDACSDNATLDGNVYTAPSTRGAEPIRMYVKGRISMQDFGEKCMALYSRKTSNMNLVLEKT